MINYQGLTVIVIQVIGSILAGLALKFTFIFGGSGGASGNAGSGF